MDASLFLAKLLGLYLVIIIPAVFVSRKNLGRIVADFSSNLGLLFFSGIFNILIGLLLILFHNIWVADWRVIITLLGWMALLKGLMRIYMPEKVLTIFKKFNEVTLIFWCAIFFILGLYLIYKGFVI